MADIKSGYLTPDPAFAEDAAAYAGDNGVAIRGSCDQLAVIIADTDPVYFGTVAGATSYPTTIRSVGRVTLGSEGQGVPAFLMLERKRCDVLSEAVGTGGGQGIIVDPATPTDPGIIHVDSSASPATGCNGNNGPAGWAVYSSGIGGGPGIVANPAGSVPGIIAIHALEIGTPPAAYPSSTATGVSPTPTTGAVVSRAPVDEKYNPTSSPTISDLHRNAYLLATRTTAPDATWTTLTCGDNNGVFTATKIFVNCPGGFSPDTLTFSSATQVVFNGPVQISNNKSLFMPAAQQVIVGGSSSQGLEVKGGRLGINSTAFLDTDAGVGAACVGREGPGAGGSNTNTTRLVIFGGSSTPGALDISGRAALCQTFVYLAGPKVSSNQTYARQAVTNGTYDPSCTSDRPCAADSTTSPANARQNAHLVVSGFVRWSAPNQSSTQPAAGAAGIEDLAFWTETDTLSQVKSGGQVEAFGVFFLPNGRLEMRSPASATPRDAQFISRTLRLVQGTLRMKPTPGNNVQIPVIRAIALVR
ncbi:MAG: hypothetical protein H0W25_17240 [Acidimicrobiia bacterium]|nr:hypothetical protein [Acidimicrobiia bacterium]